MKSIIITGASGDIGYAFSKQAAKDYDYIAICGHKNADTLERLRTEIAESNNTLTTHSKNISCENTICENTSSENTTYENATCENTICENTTSENATCKNTVDEIITSKNTVCKSFLGDISDYGFVADMVETVAEEAGGIDALVNIAGMSHIGLLTKVTPEMWHSIMSTNLTSVYNTCHCVVPYMVRNKSGKIINISSVWGLVGASCEVAYSAAKGGINSFSRALAKELAPSNISVNAIALGAIDTKMNDHLDSDERLSLCEEIPYGKMATPDEAATFIKNILNMPSYFTGEVVKFDGGWI